MFLIIFKTLLTKTIFWSLQKLPHNHVAKSLLKIMHASAISLQGKGLDDILLFKIFITTLASTVIYLV